MESLSCPELTLGEWGKQLMARLGERRYPLSATFELTERCNLGCVHCFINQPAGCQDIRQRELSTDEVKKVLEQMAEAGVVNLLLTGGEVFLRPDFEEIYRHAKRLGMLVMVFTNGTLLNQQLADFLAEWPPYFIEISLYGHTRETYEGITTVSGSFERCRRAIGLLLDRKLNLGLKTIVLTKNRFELGQMKAFAEELGVPFRYDGMIWPGLDGGQDPLQYRLSPQEVVALDIEDPQRAQGFARMQERLVDGYQRKDSVFSCGAGFYSFHVDSYGQMGMCMMARQPAYDLRNGTVQQGWQFLDSVRVKPRRQDNPCRDCQDGLVCPQCAGWSQMVHGNDEMPVDFVCQIGHLRAELISCYNK